MEKWLVISNCNTFGIANSLQAQANDVIVTGVDTTLFRSNPEKFNSEMGTYQTLFIAEGVKRELSGAEIGKIKHHVALPMFTFHSYHPDLIYLQHLDQPVTGPAGDYHSAITYSCFLKGLNITDTLRYFTGSFFERCGYMSLWKAERDSKIEEMMTLFGLDIAAPIRRWGREQAFMLSINHPRIHVLYDIATGLLHAQGRKPFLNGILPHDNLLTGACFAVYPEIGEALGVRGEYIFKGVGSYRSICLAEFIERCFEIYQKFPTGSLTVHPEFQSHTDYIGSLI